MVDGGDAGEQACGGAAAVAFEVELVFEAVDDRFDALTDPADRRVGPVGLVGAAGSKQECAQLADGGFEVGAGEALVADDRRALDRVGFEQRERRVTLSAVGGDEVEVADRAVGGAEQHEFEAPVAARVGRAVAETSPGRELAAAGCLDRLAAGKRCGVEQTQIVAGAERLCGERLPKQHELRRQPPATLVVARLRRQIGKEVSEPSSGAAQEDTVAWTLQQHLSDQQRQQLVVADQLRAAAARRPLGRKQCTGSAIKRDHEGVEVGAHVGLLVDGALTPPTFDTPDSGPCYPVLTAPAVNYRSTI